MIRSSLAWTVILVASLGAIAPVAAPRITNLTRYRIGSAPRPEFNVEGQSYRVDPATTHVQRVRELRPEEFDPMRRRQRVADFYRDHLGEAYADFMRMERRHCGPFRWEFVYWTTRWQMALRARWAWAHRRYIDSVLWAQWMADAEFAAQINMLQAQRAFVPEGYLPPEYASTSSALIYCDEYLDAVYNPVPFLAVLPPVSLKPDPQSSWIGKAVSQSLVTKISMLPGMYVLDSERTARVVGIDQRAAEDTSRAAMLAKKLDVQQIIVGDYVTDGDRVLFNLRIVDAETGKEVTGISQTVARDKMLDALPEFAVTLAKALNPDPPPAPPPTTTAPRVASGPTDGTVVHVRRVRHERAGSELPEGAVETDMVGGHGGLAFVNVDPSGGRNLVVGFRYSMGQWRGRQVLRTLDPIFARESPQPDDDRYTTILARDGYMVGGLVVDTDGINAVAVRVGFIKLNDGRLDVNDHYLSDWIGGEPSRITVINLGGHGERVLGTFGHKGLNLDAVGLVIQPLPTDGGQLAR